MRRFTSILIALCMLYMPDTWLYAVTPTPQAEISIFDFKETPMTEVLKVFTDLTDQNIVASQAILDEEVTLFLKNVKPRIALKTLCKLYNFWYSEEENVIRIMSVEDYLKELSIRRDQKSRVYVLKHASCLAVAELIENLFGDRIEYEEPDESESYGHVGTDDDDDSSSSSSSRRSRRSGSSSGRSRTQRDIFIPEDIVQFDNNLSSKTLEQIESQAMEKGVEVGEVMQKEAAEAVVYLAVFERNNTIVARSVDMRILEEIEELVRQIDTPTSQILLEGKILEITLDDDFESFFDFDIVPDSTARANNTNPNVTGDLSRKHLFGLGQYAALDSSSFMYSFVDSQIQAQIELYESNKQVKVIATPMILCANNSRGEFFIGEERPITINYEFEIREFEQRTTETMRPVIELRSIGTKLYVTPSINDNGTVTMRFYAEVDTVNPDGTTVTMVNREGNSVTLPIDTVDSSRVENIIVAKDQSMLAIGGLVRETDNNVEQKVPFLSDLPFVGFFFKKSSIKKEKTEIIFLIKPHIMSTPDHNQDVSDKLMKKLSDHPVIKHGKDVLLHEEEFNKELRNGKQTNDKDLIKDYLFHSEGH